MFALISCSILSIDNVQVTWCRRQEETTLSSQYPEEWSQSTSSGSVISTGILTNIVCQSRSNWIKWQHVYDKTSPSNPRTRVATPEEKQKVKTFHQATFNLSWISKLNQQFRELSFPLSLVKILDLLCWWDLSRFLWWLHWRVRNIVISSHLHWTNHLINEGCNFNELKQSDFRYNFRLLDTSGWNFRHAHYHEEGRRTLYKAYGIKFVIIVQGMAGIYFHPEKYYPLH